MTSSTSRAGAPERPGAGTAECTYRYGRFYRSPAFVLLASAVLLTVFVLWEALSGTPTLEWAPFLFFLVLIVVNGFQSAGRLLSTFRLTEDQLRQERPLRADKDVSLSEIRRLFVGGHSVEVYTSSPGSEPDLEFERKLQGGNELIEKLARRLPPGAEIEHPSGELAERLSEVAASVLRQRPDGTGFTDPADTLGVHRSENEGAAENR